MRLYRVMDYSGLQETLEKKVINTNSDIFEPDNGWGIFGNRCYMNTFTDVQNRFPHFYPFAIDAAYYMIRERKNCSDYFCVLDIPDNYIEKGYGFYPQKTSPEYVSNQDVSSQSIVYWTSDKSVVADYVLNELQDSIKWYSTVGKAIYMCMDQGFLCHPICGNRTMGGFIFSFQEFLEQILSIHGTKDSEEIKQIINSCINLNKYYYSLLDFVCNKESAIDFNNIRKQFVSEQVKNASGAGILFEQLENKYTLIGASEEEAKLKQLVKPYVKQNL